MDFIHHSSLPFWALMFLKEKYPLKDMDHQTLTVYSTVYEFANFLKRNEIEDPCTDDISDFIKKYPPINMWWYDGTDFCGTIWRWIYYYTQMSKMRQDDSSTRI